MNILKNKIRSICQECFEEIDARIIEDKGKVFMLKNCEKHGKSKILIEKNAFFYKKVINQPIEKKIPYSNIMIPVTSRCNLNCKICFYPKREGCDIPLDRYEQVISTFEGNKIRISGGEPTLRKDICNIIECTLKHGKKPLLTTNGLLLSDINLVRKLKQAGLDTLCFSFNGFEEHTDLGINDESVCNLKLKALENLKKEGLHISLSTLVHRGINENELEKIFDFVLEQHPFVHEWRIRTSNIVGKHTNTEPFFLSELFDLVTGVICKKLPFTKERIMKHFIQNKSKIDYGPCRFYTDFYKKNSYDETFNSISYRKNLPSLRISLRSWPNKHTVDLEEIKRCRSAFLIENGSILPACYAFIMGEKKIKL